MIALGVIVGNELGSMVLPAVGIQVGNELGEVDGTLDGELVTIAEGSQEGF